MMERNLKRSKTKGLAYKLSLSILTGTSLLIFVILFYNYHVSKRLLLESAGATSEQLIKATMGRLESVITSVQKMPEGVAIYLQNPEVSDEELKGMLSLALQNKPELFGCCVAFAPYSFKPGKEGYAPYAYRTAEGIQIKYLDTGSYRYFDKDWYTFARDKGKPVWTEPYFDIGGGNVLMATYSFPFYTGDSLYKVFRGVATADLSLDWLEQLMNSLTIFQTGYAFLFSEKGTIITHPNKEYQFRNIREFVPIFSDPALLEKTIKLLEGEKGYIPFHSQINNKPCLLFLSIVPQTHWQMAVVITEDELFAGLQRLYVYTVFIGILGLILLAVVVILISARITKPLRRLTLTAEEIGAGNFDIPIEEKGSTREISMLGNALGRMQQELKKYMKNLEITAAAKERIESELNIAHNIQQGMIPKVFPPFPDRKDIDIYAVLEPARQVGGDLYDFFFLDDDTLCFAIGDVSDKGVPASLMMAITITLFRAKTDNRAKTNEIVTSINQYICQGNVNLLFVTFFMGILNMRTGEVNFCNAGHNYPLLLRKDGSIDTLEETHGVPLGLDKHQVYQFGNILLGKEDSLILFTDGITEAISVDRDFYGDDRLEELIRKCNGLTPEQITRTILKDVSGFTRTPEKSDDITLMVISYYPQDKM
jgi:phosphoserine phosphatase RsbU/P